MQRPAALGALCLALTAAACGGGGDDRSEADIKTDLSESLQSGVDDLDAEAADCFAQLVIDEVGLDELRDVDLSADQPPAEIQDDITAAATRAAEECDLTSVGD